MLRVQSFDCVLAYVKNTHTGADLFTDMSNWSTCNIMRHDNLDVIDVIFLKRFNFKEY